LCSLYPLCAIRNSAFVEYISRQRISKAADKSRLGFRGGGRVAGCAWCRLCGGKCRCQGGRFGNGRRGNSWGFRTDGRRWQFNRAGMRRSCALLAGAGWGGTFTGATASGWGLTLPGGMASATGAPHCSQKSAVRSSGPLQKRQSAIPWWATPFSNAFFKASSATSALKPNSSRGILNTPFASSQEFRDPPVLRRGEKSGLEILQYVGNQSVGQVT
jgi:hypothetical protein